MYHVITNCTEELYFEVAENTDEMAVVKYPHKRYITNSVIIIVVITTNPSCTAQFPGTAQSTLYRNTQSI